jgi:hypothetical protein
MSSDPDRPRVIIYDESLLHTPETMAWFVREAGYEPLLLFRRIPRVGEHEGCAERLAGVGIAARPLASSEPLESELFVLQLSPNGPPDPGVRAWMRRARRVRLMAHGTHPSRPRALLTLVQHLDYLRRAEAILSFGPDRTWFRSLARRIPARRAHHPRFILDRSGRVAHERILAAPFAESRAYRFHFAGNGQSPPARAALLERLQADLGRDHDFHHEHPAGTSSGPRRVLWVTSPRHPRLNREAYLDSLCESEFCLSPAGWSVWTHRTIEALQAGSIPILPQPEAYHLGLLDGVHCLAVRGDDWEGAVARARGLRAAERHAMREAITALRQRALTLSALSAHYLSILGLTASAGVPAAALPPRSALTLSPAAP